jgi:hypothetical protein
MCYAIIITVWILILMSEFACEAMLFFNILKIKILIFCFIGYD